MQATIGRAIRRDSRPIVGGNDAPMSRSIWRHISPPGCPQATRPSRFNSDAVLGGINALRCASTVRTARPAGVDAACAPLESGKLRDGRGSITRFDRD
jgi:hypothetical protein